MRRFYLTLAFLLGTTQVCSAKAPPEAPSYALPFCNFRDLAMEGYCLGASSIHGFSRLPDERLEAVFGKDTLHSFRADPATNEIAALKLLRTFSLLQTEESYQKTIEGLPEIPTQRTLEANGYVMSQDSMGFMKSLGKGPQPEWDQAAARAVANRDIEKIYQLLQSPAGKETGAFATVIIAKHEMPPQRVGFHSLYFFSAEKKGKRYQFRYLDPNLPEVVQTFTYDAKNSSSRFSTDNSKYYSVLKNLQPGEEIYRLYTNVVQQLRTSPKNQAKILLSFLHLPNSSPSFDALYQGSQLADTPALQKTWLNHLNQLESEIYRIHRIQKGKFSFKDPISLAHSTLDDRLEDLSQELRASLTLAAQSQLDSGCDTFKKFFEAYLDGLESPGYRDPELLDIADATEIPFLPGSHAEILISNLLDWTLVNPSRIDKQQGRQLALNHRQQECITHTIFPLLMKKVGESDSLYWALHLDRKYLLTLLKKYDWLTAETSLRKLLRENLAHLNPEMTLNTLLILAQSDDLRLKNNALIALQDLNTVQQEVRTRWAQDLKQHHSEFPPRAAQRSLYLLRSLSLPDGTTWEGKPVLWQQKDIPKNFRAELQKFSEGWSTFFKAYHPSIQRQFQNQKLALKKPQESPTKKH